MNEKILKIHFYGRYGFFFSIHIMMKFNHSKTNAINLIIQNYGYSE